jgi:SAM-dependent methyltransferase
VGRAGTFDELVAGAEAEPVEGWDFSWLEGRATETRPSWGYARRVLPPRIAGADSLLDLQTGGGEVLATALGRAARTPPVVAATESWAPNLAIATRNLAPWGVTVTAASDEGPLPAADGAHDLVISRHPVVVAWAEIARVLRPGGTYLSQQVGPDANRELYEALMGPQRAGPNLRSASSLRAGASSVGLEVVRVVDARPELVFYDIGAVVYFLRKVIWTVPDFTVDAYRSQLLALHARIERDGGFVSHAPRILLEARKPGR